MAFKDLLLHLDTYPDPAPPECVDRAVDLCAQLSASVTGVAVHVQIPLKSNGLADFMIRLSDLAEQEEQRSLENAQSLLHRLQEQASARGLAANGVVAKAQLVAASDRVAEIARTYDACMVPYGADGGAQAALAEAVIFNSGRPVIIFKGTTGREHRSALERVVIAWDASPAAARAVADAMPLLVAAKEVRVLAVLNEKPTVAGGIANGLSRHLAAHGVTAVVDEVDGDGREIGIVIGQHIAQQQPDLLVMGAYGHSRLREFVLGGATRSVISNPPIPVLLSH